MAQRSAIGAVLLCCAQLAVTACASPPTREMDQAQGAIDAARAARADRYAPAEYEAAVTALKQADAAVIQHDYRLALNYALDSRDRAQEAAKKAADEQATLRSSVERRLSELTAMLDQANQRLAAADKARVARRLLAEPRKTIAAAETSLQKAGTDVQEGDYYASQEKLSSAATQLKAAIAAIDAVMPGKTKGRR
jgi:hypothetical protein